MCVGVLSYVHACRCHRTCVEVRGQFVGTSFLFLPYELEGSSLGSSVGTWQQIPFTHWTISTDPKRIFATHCRMSKGDSNKCHSTYNMGTYPSTEDRVAYEWRLTPRWLIHYPGHFSNPKSMRHQGSMLAARYGRQKLLCLTLCPSGIKDMTYHLDAVSNRKVVFYSCSESLCFLNSWLSRWHTEVSHPC